jgi:ketosteroid isomerase-like protein
VVQDGGALDTLREANARFYRALEGLDVAAMEELWVPEGWVHCVHPGWDILAGWETIRQSWEQIFANTRWLRVTPTSVEATVIGDVGLVVCSENITATTEGDVGVAVAQATNVFRMTPQGWRMFHHHASPAPVRVTQPFSGTVQ